MKLLERLRSIDWKNDPRVRAAALMGSVVLLAVLMRFPRIEADIPFDMENTSSPQLDVFYYLEQAICKADGTKPTPLLTYERPLWTAVAFAWFKVFGTGCAQANALGATLATLGVAVTLAIGVRGLGLKGGLAAGAGLAVSYPFVALGRTPLIYTPVTTLITIAALLWCEALRRERRLFVRLALGAFALGWLAETALLFKGVSFVLVPPLVVALVAAAGPRAVRVAAIGAAIAVGMLLVVYFIDPGHVASWNRDRILSYLPILHEDGVVWGTLRRLLLVGGKRTFVRFTTAEDVLGRWIGSNMAATSPLFFALATIGLALAWRDRARVAAHTRVVLALAASWVTFFVLIYSQLDYRPPRFCALVAPAAAILAGWTVARIAGAAELAPATPRTPRGRVLDTAVVFWVAWFFFSHLLALPRDDAPENHEIRWAPDRAGWTGNNAFGESFYGDKTLVFIALLFAAGIAYLEWRRRVETTPVVTVTQKKSKKKDRDEPVKPPLVTARGWVAIAVVFFLVVGNAREDLRAMAEPPTLARANRAVRAMLGPKALLCSHVATSLVAGSSIEHRVGNPPLDVQEGSFMAQLVLARLAGEGITHLALIRESAGADKFAGWARAAKQPPELVATIYQRKMTLLLYRLAGAEQRGYQLSAFERGRLLDDKGDLDGARAAYGSLDAPLGAARARALMYLGKPSEAYRAVLDAPQDDWEIAGLKQEILSTADPTQLKLPPVTLPTPTPSPMR